MEKSYGVFTVTYLDNTVPGLLGGSAISLDHNVAQTLARDIGFDYPNNLISDTEQRYLIKGVVVEADEVGSHAGYDGMVRRIQLKGETVTAISLVAKTLGLPLPRDSAIIPNKSD